MLTTTSPILILCASPAGAGLPPSPPLEVVMAPEEPTMAPRADAARLIEIALCEAGVVDEQPGASWFRPDGAETRCEVTLYREGEAVGHGLGYVEGTGAAQDFASWLMALGRALAVLASGRPCACLACEESRLPEEAR